MSDVWVHKHDGKQPRTERQFERMADALVMARLSTDTRYRNAENAQEQDAAEVAIEREVIDYLETRYYIDSVL